MAYTRITLGLPKHRRDAVSVRLIRFRFDELRDAIDRLWKKRFNFGPRPGLSGRIEVSEKSHVHAHMLRLGKFTDVSDILDTVRDVSPSANGSSVEVEIAWRDPEDRAAMEKLVATSKYPEKGARADESPDEDEDEATDEENEEVESEASQQQRPKEPSKHSFVHPLVFVLAEIALFKAQTRIGKGSMRGLASAEKARRKRTRAHAVRNDICANCGECTMVAGDFVPAEYKAPSGRGFKAHVRWANREAKAMKAKRLKWKNRADGR